MAHLIELILTTSTKGKGLEDNPVRTVTELWTKDGVLVASYDQWSGDVFLNDPKVWGE